MIPGGPGLASVLPYRLLRKRFAKAGYQVAMVEHRGVGLSRCAADGTDLPLDVLTVDAVVGDTITVLDDLGWDTGVTVYGTSYGGWVAQKLVIAAADRISGLVLDSTFSSVDEHEVRRRLIRTILTDRGPLSSRIIDLIDKGLLSERDAVRVLPPTLEFGGDELANKLLDALEKGHKRAWNWVANAGDNELHTTTRYVMEFDLVGVIMHREVDSTVPDGRPFDPVALFDRTIRKFGAYEGEPENLRPALASVTCPVAVVCGARDLRSPVEVAQRTADALPNSTLLLFPDTAHSILDTRPAAALEIVNGVVNARLHELADQTAELERRSKWALRTFVPRVLSAWVSAELAFGAVRRRLPHRK
nr:alpha/beta hydrolase [Hoyosella altamirensis]